MAPLPKPQSKITEMIYAAWEARAESWDSLGFSPSMLGSGCDRALWYQLRWIAAPEVMTGQKLRLFETGNIEEQRIIAEFEWLEDIELDPVDPQNGRQWSIRGLAGHVRGKMDGIIWRGVPEAPAKPHVFEAKSHGVKSWKRLKDAGAGNLREGKYEHWVQVQTYMHVTGIDRGLYSATCKDTDERWNDRVRYDHEFCTKLFIRLERIARSPAPPPPISEARNAPDCRFCKAKPVCQAESWARVTCRSCLHSTPEFHGDAAWSCARHSKPLLPDEQRAACANHLFIPAVVPGEQIDADEAAETVTYRLADGRLWIDGEQASPAPIPTPTEDAA